VLKEKLRSQKILPLITVMAFNDDAGGLLDGWKDYN